MGYKPQKTEYELSFEDGDLAGLEVRARGIPLGQFLDMVSLADEAQQNAGKVGPDAVRKMLDFLVAFADVLVSWNVEDEDGAPVPANLDGVRTQEFPFVLEIVKVWMGAAAGVSGPLEQTSNDGSLSEMALIPTETLSSSLAS